MVKRREKTVKIPFVEGLKSNTVEEISIDDIDSINSIFQYRFTTDIGDLMRSLAIEGQKEPIDLAEYKPHRIIDGFRRVKAISTLGWKTVKAFVHKGISEDDAHRMAFIKNVVRKNLGPMEKANAIHQALKRGRKMLELTEYFGLSEKQLKRYEALVGFSTEIKKLLDEERITMGHAKALSDFEVKDADEWMNKIKENNLSAKQLRRALKIASGGRISGRAKLYIKKEKNGIRVYPFTITKDAPDKERVKIIALLQEAIEIIKG